MEVVRTPKSPGSRHHRLTDPPFLEDADLWLSRRTDGLVPGLLFAGIAAGILLLDGRGRWAWPAALLIVLLAVLASPPRRIVLHDDVLVEQRHRGDTHVPLAEITDIRLDWVWKAGEQLVITSGTQQIRFEDLLRAEKFLLALGRALGARANRRVVASSREARLLGLDLRWGQHPAAGTHQNQATQPDPGTGDAPESAPRAG